MSSAAAFLMLTGRSASIDPAAYALEELARIRGAMWSVRWNGPLGPRPGQATNILAMDYYEWFGPEDRARMRAIYRSRWPDGGLIHAPTGPMVDAGYRPGMYPAQTTVPDQARWDLYLDCMEEWWAAGIVPVHFMHPDNWTFEQTRDQLSALYAQPRAKQLLRVLVPTGWEPSQYEWSSNTWCLFFDWAAALNPGALLLMHTVSDNDCPNGKDAHGDDSDQARRSAWGEIWAKYAPRLHGWLVQNGPYDCAPARNPELARNFAAQWRDLGSRFRTGRRADGAPVGWPTSSRWGINRRLRIYNAECTAYNSFWRDLPEEETRDWGDLAIASGADGYLDGGRVEVR